jgi:tRNA A-37 threonylcarbamoyl transferase component Bud32
MADENYNKFSCPGGTGTVIKSMTPSLSPCLHHPDDYLDDGIIIKDSISTKVAIAKLNDNTQVFIKRYNNKSLRYTLRYLFRATRPFRVHRAVQKLNQLNIPTPNIFAALSMRKFSIIPASFYVIHEYWDNCLTAKEFFKLLYHDTDRFKEFCSTITGYLAKMHHAGIRHNDLKLSNICCRRTESHFIFGFWDLDGVRIFNSSTVPTEFIYLDIARLISSWLSHGKTVKLNSIRSDIVDCFLKPYSEHADFIFDLEILDKHIDRFLKRKKRKKQQ